MGFSADSRGKPSYTPTPTQTVTDLQAAADWADKVGAGLRGTSVERGLLTSSEIQVGQLFVETDTGAIFMRVAGGWESISEPWKTYTPTFTGVSGTLNLAKYKIERKLVTVRVRFTVAGITANPLFTLPVPAADSVDDILLGNIGLIPSSGSNILTYPRRESGQVRLWHQTVISSAVYLAGVTPSVPTFNWPGARIEAYVQYEAA